MFHLGSFFRNFCRGQVPMHTSNPDQQNELRNRLKLLLSVLWDGNRAEMGRQIGISHTAINKVVNGRGAPGRKLLQAVAAHPKVNSTWLRTGAGTPLLAPREATPGLESTLPISRLLLPVPPAEGNPFFTGQRWPVPASDYRATRYFLELKGDQPILCDDRERFANGDLLLFDSDIAARSRITSNESGLCVVRTSGDELDVKLARLRARSDAGDQPVAGDYDADFFAGANRAAMGTRLIVDIDRYGAIQDSRSIPQRAKPAQKPQKRRRKGEVVPDDPGPISTLPETITVNDILAVCVLCVRRQP